MGLEGWDTGQRKMRKGGRGREGGKSVGKEIFFASEVLQTRK